MVKGVMPHEMIVTEVTAINLADHALSSGTVWIKRHPCTKNPLHQGQQRVAPAENKDWCHSHVLFGSTCPRAQEHHLAELHDSSYCGHVFTVDLGHGL